MAGKSAWVAGNGAGLTWTTAINSADMASMSNGQTVLSSVADIANGTNLDLFGWLSFKLAISSSSIVAGANIAFWIFGLNQDGTHYGDGQFTAGTAASLTPSFGNCFQFNLVAAASQTALIGDNLNVGPLALPPWPFRFAMQNNSGFALTAGTQTVKFGTSNMNLNN
jgi:hypothetical protein